MILHIDSHGIDIYVETTMGTKNDQPKPLACGTHYAARLLGTSDRHIQRLLQRGELVGFRLGGRWRISVDAINQLLKRIPD